MNISEGFSKYIRSGKLVDIYNRFKKDKKAFIALLAAAIGLLMIFFSEAEDVNTENESSEESCLSDTEDIESSLRSIVGCIKGVGDVEVLVTYDSTFEYVYAENTESKSDKDQLQSRSEYILTDGDSGLILKKVYPKIRGVAIICQGGDNPIITEKIYSIVSALFDISTNNISVADME